MYVSLLCSIARFFPKVRSILEYRNINLYTTKYDTGVKAVE